MNSMSLHQWRKHSALPSSLVHAGGRVRLVDGRIEVANMTENKNSVGAKQMCKICQIDGQEICKYEFPLLLARHAIATLM